VWLAKRSNNVAMEAGSLSFASLRLRARKGVRFGYGEGFCPCLTYNLCTEHAFESLAPGQASISVAVPSVPEFRPSWTPNPRPGQPGPRLPWVGRTAAAEGRLTGCGRPVSLRCTPGRMPQLRWWGGCAAFRQRYVLEIGKGLALLAWVVHGCFTPGPFSL
jgi:hypothetical protein